MERIEVKFASEEIDAAGTFAGYGAVFGNMDSHGDIIVPGAFGDSLKAWQGRGRLPSMKLMHGTGINPFNGDDLPIGVWTSMREDAQGLRVEGKLSAMDTDIGRRVYGLMKDGALAGLSIGYRAKRAVPAPRGAAHRRMLEAVDVFEVSVVDEPSNDRAKVLALKSLDALGIEDFREIEAILRTKGLSRADAVKAVSGLKDWLRRDAGAPDTLPRDEVDAALVEALRRNVAILTS